MKVIKPLKLGLLHRPFEHGGKAFLSIGVLVHFDFSAPDRPLLEADLWKTFAEVCGESAVLDEGMPKHCAELVVYGDAHAPGGTPVPALQVTAKLGELEKTIYVAGDRRWRLGAPTEPEPFTSMPIDWEHAFGGPGFEQNPRGIGMVAVTDPTTDETYHPLPNIEHPKRTIGSKDDRPEPTSLQPLDVTWPQRRGFAGTHDARWLKEHAPGFPEDMSLEAFQQTAPDQWHDDELAAGAPFSVTHMHPDHPMIESRLPELGVKAFLEIAGEDELRDVAMKPETVVLFPAEEQGVLIFRGVTPIAEDDAHDVSCLMVAAEEMATPKPRSHYTTVFGQRTDPERSHLYLLREHDLLPATERESPPVPPDPLREREGHVVANMERKAQRELDKTRQQLVEQGIDPDEHGVPKVAPKMEEPPDIDHLDEAFDRAQKEAAEKQAEAEAKKEEAEKLLRTAAERHGLDYEKMLESARQDQAGPPKFRAKDELDNLRQQFELSRRTGVALPEVERQLADPRLFENLQKVEHRLFELYRDFARHFPAAATCQGDEADRIRAEVTRAIDAGESLENRDLTGANLRGMDLREAALEGAFLEAADLAGCTFTGANLERTVFTRANMEGVDLKGAKLAGANLAQANLRDAKLAETDLTEAKLDEAELAGADFSRCTFDGVSFDKARLPGSSWVGATAEQLMLIECDISEVSFANAKLTKPVFLTVKAKGTDFSGASLESPVFVTIDAEEMRFDGAVASKLIIVNESRAVRSSFAGAHLPGAQFRGTDLTGASFKDATLDGADLSECNLAGSVFVDAHAAGSMWMRTDLRASDMTRMNAMTALMNKADLRGTNLRHTNLFRSMLTRIKTDAATSFEGALLDEAQLKPIESDVAQEDGDATV